MANRPISDAELLAAIDAAEQTALGAVEGQVTIDRADAVDRYYGKAYGDEQAGRSSVVSRDVADVVEGVVANVVKPFVGGDEVVRFDPLGPDDEERAEQETDYVNHIALERNNGFVWLVSAIKDTLLLRSGYVKCQWTKRSDVILETYSGMSEEEVGLLLEDGGVELVEHTAYPDPAVVLPPADPLQPPPEVPMVHDLKVKRTRPSEYVSIDPVPPEEILVSDRARSPSLADVDFVQHRTRKTLSELRQAGYAVEDGITDDETGESIEETARQRFGTAGDLYDDDTNDPSRRMVMYKETYIKIDRNGDGIAELMRVCSVGSTLLHEEECDIIPIASFSGVMVPHQHYGISVYDLVEDLAKIKTALIRSYLDNRYLQNNARAAVDVNRVNIDDFLVARPGGVVRVEGDPATAIFPIVTPDTSTGALQGLEYLDSVRESRTGYTRNSAGIDNDALTNRTATGMAMQLSQSQLRLEMIARTIAETGVRDVFRIIHALTLKYSSRAEKVRLKGKWIEINPREWVRRSDVSIAIGLGSGTTEQQLGKLMQLAQFIPQLQGMGLVGVVEAYNFAAEVFKLSGYKSPDKFVRPPEIDPQTGKPAEPPQQPPPQVQVEQMRLQADQQKTQAMLQAEQQKLQATQLADVQRFQAEQQAAIAQAERDAALKRAEMEMQLQVQAANDQRQAELDRQKMALDVEKMKAEYEFKRWEKEFDAQLQMQLESMRTQPIVTGAEETKAVAALVKEMRDLMDTPREVIRDASGRVAGVRVGNRTQTVRRDAQGRVTGVH